MINPATPVEDAGGSARHCGLCAGDVGESGLWRAEVHFVYAAQNAAIGRDSQQRGLTYRIEVDGGVGLDTVADVVRAGAEILVAGNAVFGSGDPRRNAEALLQAARKPPAESVARQSNSLERTGEAWLERRRTGDSPEIIARGLMSRRIIGYGAGYAAVVQAACTNKKSVNPLADLGSKQPDKVLFDRAMDAMNHNRFDVARLTLQTLINTYPDSEFIARAKLAVGDSWYAEGGRRRWRRRSKNTEISIPSSPTCRRRPKRS